MQKIKEEGAVKSQSLLLLLKSPKILDQFKGAGLKQIKSVHKRCIVISSPDPQLHRFCCFFQGYRKSPIKSPGGGGGGGGGVFFSTPFGGGV